MKTFLEIRKKNQDRLYGENEYRYSDKYFKRFIKRLARKIIWANRFGRLSLKVEHINPEKFRPYYCAYSIRTALMETGLFGKEDVFTILCLEEDLIISWAIDRSEK